MKLKGLVIVAGMLLAFATTSVAQTPEETQQTPSSGPEEEEEKGGFWKDRFALYVETLSGTASGKDIDTSVTTTGVQVSENSLTFDDLDMARLTIGWKLPEGKGDFRLVFTGVKESEYTFEGIGKRTLLLSTMPGGPIRDAPEPVEWWRLNIGGRQLVSTAQTPTWDPVDDANGNGFPDLDEINFLPSNLGTTRDAVETLENQVQTLDFFFQRDWGGRKVNARWGAGLRYFVYEGNILAGAWLATSDITATTYTEGASLRPIVFTQDTSGLGPSGFAELHYNFLRERIVLYWMVRAAFVLESLETDSGTFFSLVADPQGSLVFPAEARLIEDRDKDVWHTGAEFGSRVRLVNGLTLHLAYYITTYKDSVLVPTGLGLPENLQGIAQGASALYTTRDIELDGWRGGFSYQF